MNWWEDGEARAHRERTPATMAQALYQRLVQAGVDPDLAFVPAYDLAHLHDLCADFVKLVEGILVAADGDRVAIRRQGLALSRWAGYALQWTRQSASAFNLLVDSLNLEAEELAAREEMQPEEDWRSPLPEAEAKQEGRYRHFHLLYERLDLKLSSIDLETRVHRNLARAIARIYEQCLITIRLLSGLQKDSDPRFGRVARLLLEINTSWHFDLGPYHLGHGELRARGLSAPGLHTWLLLAFG